MSCPDNIQPIDWSKVKVILLPPSEVKPHPNQWFFDMLKKQQECDHDFCLTVQQGKQCYKCELILMQLE